LTNPFILASVNYLATSPAIAVKELIVLRCLE